jgi:hypothetical protein
MTEEIPKKLAPKKPKYQFRPYRPRFIQPRINFRPRMYRPPRRRMQRLPRLRIMYGQQQDLAFGNTGKKGMGNTFTTPVSESKVLESYFKFTNDTITFCQPIPTQNYILATAIIPLHPMLFPGRTANMALNFASFQLQKCTVHYVPLIGSTSTGMIAIGATRNSTPLTYNTPDQFTALTQISAEINPVWMCTKYNVRDLDTNLKNMAPINRNDLPNIVYVVGSGLAGTMVASATIFIEMSIKLSRPNPSPSLTAMTAYTQITIAAGGIRTSVALPNNVHGIVLNSTATNIDVGEYVQIPPMPVIATDYDISFTHNNSQTDYLNVPDQGTIYVIYFTEN